MIIIMRSCKFINEAKEYLYLAGSSMGARREYIRTLYRQGGEKKEGSCRNAAADCLLVLCM